MLASLYCELRYTDSTYHFSGAGRDISVLESSRSNVGQGTLDDCDTTSNRVLGGDEVGEEQGE